YYFYDNEYRMIAPWGLIILIILQNLIFAQDVDPIKLSWLGGNPPALSTGVSWGVPLPEGKIDPSSSYKLTNDHGENMPTQYWPLAYWPDGSLKWVGLSTVVDSNSGTSFQLKPLNKAKVIQSVTQVNVTETDDYVFVNTGILQCEIPKSGKQLIHSLKLNGKLISSDGRLICILQNGPNKEVGSQPSKEKFIGNIEKVTVEQSGPIRAVIKIEGMNVSESGNRSLLPFIVRLYLYAGQQSVRIVHTFIYDGDQQKDFIRGLGIVFDVPLDEQLYNRHIRFSGENGRLWDEPCEPLNGRRPLDFKEDLYAKQLIGERIAERETFSEQQQYLIDHWATWNDFKLEQLNADGFRIQKRTNDESTWIGAGYGKRSEGMAFVGDVSGGLAICVRDFWQSFPSALEISNVKTDKAQLKAWFWSPEAEAMDMRHYDTLAWGHTLEASYEDVQPGFSTPMGVGRTSEIMLFASDNVPSYETLNKIVQQGNHPALLTASPEYIHNIPVFGVWSLPDTSTKGKRWIEDQLENAFQYYQLEVEQRHWYGFWNFGDVRHG
ncbi:MAG: Tat pathway signal sequence domain protein, partial [Cyclobacteriaceae bacterium]